MYVCMYVCMCLYHSLSLYIYIHIHSGTRKRPRLFLSFSQTTSSIVENYNNETFSFLIDFSSEENVLVV